MLKKIALAVALILSTLAVVASPAEAAPNYAQIRLDESYWIATSQLPSGAIPTTKSPSNGNWMINPYFANIAARGMLHSGDPYYNGFVKAWMNWYFNHLNWPDYNGLYGTTYDYRVSSTTHAETSLGTYDSTDSYASTFLVLAADYAAITGDYAYIQSKKYQLDVISDAMRATNQTDNLTFAKPDHQIKYLMDNSEVYEGYIAMRSLYATTFNDEAGRLRFDGYAAASRNAIQTMWKNDRYEHYKGAVPSASWSVWYSDSTAQVFPAQTGALAANRQRSTLWNNFNHYWPSWVQTNQNPDSAPWMTICYAAAVQGDKVRTDACLTNSARWKTAGGADRIWPYTTAEAGMTVMAAKRGSALV